MWDTFSFNYFLLKCHLKMVEENYLSKKNIFFYSIFSTSVPARVKQCNNNTIDDQPSKLKDSTLAAYTV